MICRNAIKGNPLKLPLYSKNIFCITLGLWVGRVGRVGRAYKKNNRKSLTKHLKVLKSWVGRARGGWGAAPAESKLHLRLFKLRPKKPLQPTCLIYFALYNMENTNTCTQKYKYKQTQL